MAIFEGKKFEPALGNMRVASHAEAEKLQIILDLKAKRKLIQDEITRLCKELPSNVALVAKTTHT